MWPVSDRVRPGNKPRSPQHICIYIVYIACIQYVCVAIHFGPSTRRTSACVCAAPSPHQANVCAHGPHNILMYNKRHNRTQHHRIQHTHTRTLHVRCTCAPKHNETLNRQNIRRSNANVRTQCRTMVICWRSPVHHHPATTSTPNPHQTRATHIDQNIISIKCVIQRP